MKTVLEMKTIAIYRPFEYVMPLLVKFLETRHYKNISVNYTKGEITAEFNKFFFRSDSFFFKLIPKDESITNIEIEVNPQKALPSKAEGEKENRITDRIY